MKATVSMVKFATGVLAYSDETLPDGRVWYRYNDEKFAPTARLVGYGAPTSSQVSLAGRNVLTDDRIRF
jgi:hypothetical protein